MKIQRLDIARPDEEHSMNPISQLRRVADLGEGEVTVPSSGHRYLLKKDMAENILTILLNHKPEKRQLLGNYLFSSDKSLHDLLTGCVVHPQ